jgi:signal transduction histidine kinase
MSMEPQMIPVRTLILETEQNYRSIAAGKGVAFHVEDAAGDAEVWGDRVRLLQVLSNVLGNAIKFCDAGDSVTLRATVLDADVSISVSDSGPGIPASALHTIFDCYRTTERRPRSGTGLGLHIAKRIIERHAGRIWVESKVGLGTTFFFTLPRFTS